MHSMAVVEQVANGCMDSPNRPYTQWAEGGRYPALIGIWWLLNKQCELKPPNIALLALQTLTIHVGLGQWIYLRSSGRNLTAYKL